MSKNRRQNFLDTEGRWEEGYRLRCSVNWSVHKVGPVKLSCNMPAVGDIDRSSQKRLHLCLRLTVVSLRSLLGRVYMLFTMQYAGLKVPYIWFISTVEYSEESRICNPLSPALGLILIKGHVL